MKSEIEQFKKENGNVKYTVKELLYGVNSKIDRIEQRLDKGTGKISENRTRIESINKLFKIGIPILTGCLGGLLYLIIRFR